MDAGPSGAFANLTGPRLKPVDLLQFTLWWSQRCGSAYWTSGIRGSLPQEKLENPL